MAGFLIVAVIIGVWILIRYNQQENKSIRRAFSATGSVWDAASPDKRRRLLESAGVAKEKHDEWVSTAWQSLSDYAKSPLVNLQLKAEINVLSENNQNLDGLDRKQSGSETISKQAEDSCSSKPLTVPYFDAFCALAENLSWSIPVTEWKAGVPDGYTQREKESIDLTWSRLKSEVLRSGTPCPELEEPLRNLLGEAGLINSASEYKCELREKYFDEWDENWCEKCFSDGLFSDDLGAIVSTYLKAWLCCHNPFVLLELADFLVRAGNNIEAYEAVKVALKFPDYARNRSLNDMEVAAYFFAYELLPFGPSRDARSIVSSKGLYSSEALILLNEKAKTFQGLEGIHVKG